MLLLLLIPYIPVAYHKYAYDYFGKNGELSVYNRVSQKGFVALQKGGSQVYYNGYLGNFRYNFIPNFSKVFNKSLLSK